MEKIKRTYTRKIKYILETSYKLEDFEVDDDTVMSTISKIVRRKPAYTCITRYEYKARYIFLRKDAADRAVERLKELKQEGKIPNLEYYCERKPIPKESEQECQVEG